MAIKTVTTMPVPGEIEDLHEKLNLSGMRCAACAQLIEFRVRQLSGVTRFTINTASHRADLSWHPSKISLQKIITSIIDLGYAAFPSSQSLDDYERQENKMALWRLFIAGFAMMQVMMYSFPAYLVPVPQIDGDLTPDLDRLLKLASLIITIPVIFFSALPFFRSAIRDIKNRHVGMDVPVSLGIALSFLASVWATFLGGAVYYDSVIMFVCLLLGARYIESRVQRKTTAALRVLTRLAPALVQKLTDYPATRRTEQIDAQTLQSGDFLLVAAGELIPADGIVVEGQSECDEALMTGESHPVKKNKDAKLIAGSINLNNVLLMRAEQVGMETQLSILVGMMERAATEKPLLVQLADKHASRFLLVIMGVALLSGFAWWEIDSSRALWIAISVIVVTCPCALSLATPGVMSAAVGQLAKQGVLVAKGRAVEVLANATHFVFDKTGTLTYGKLRLVDSVFMPPRQTGFEGIGTEIDIDICTDIDIDAVTLALSSSSMHPVSKALADAISSRPGKAHSPDYLTDIVEIAGGGVEGRLHGRRIRLGNLHFVQELHGLQYDIPSHLSGKTVSALGDESGTLVLYGLEDSLREDALEAVSILQNKNKEIILLSGDRLDVVRAIALQCGIANYHGDLSPADKYEFVKHLQESGAVVVMIGDGMNDGPVLSLADVSVAMGQGAPLSQSRSDLLLMSNRLNDLAYAVKVSVMSLKLIRQNLGWAIVYNLVAIPAAVMGVLEPWHAALGMSLSSLVVVLNGLRLLSLKSPFQPLSV